MADEQSHPAGGIYFSFPRVFVLSAPFYDLFYFRTFPETLSPLDRKWPKKSAASNPLENFPSKNKINKQARKSSTVTIAFGPAASIA